METPKREGDDLVKILGYVALAVLSIVAFAAILVPFSILSGWALSWLWLWFLVPLGVPAIGLAHSIGIVSLVSFLTKQYNPTSNDTSEEKYGKLAYAVMSPFLALGIGYIVHSFM